MERFWKKNVKKISKSSAERLKKNLKKILKKIEKNFWRMDRIEKTLKKKAPAPRARRLQDAWNAIRKKSQKKIQNPQRSTFEKKLKKI